MSLNIVLLEMKPTQPRLGVLQIVISPDTQTEKAREEVKALLAHFVGLTEKEGLPISDTIRCLFDYYEKTPEERISAREIVSKANIGYGIDTHMHVFHKLEEPKRKKKNQSKPSIDSLIKFNNIVGYICFCDDFSLHNPVIYVGDRFIIKEHNSNGFFRTMVRNLMDSQNARVPLFKTDIRTHNAEDLILFISLGFEFVRPYGTEDITAKGAQQLSNAFIEDVKGKEKEEDYNISSLTDTYRALFDDKFKIFHMARITPACHACKKSDNITFQQCSRCRSVFYCSPECAKSAWSTHKIVCNGNRI